MDLKATVASGYRNRLLLITIGALLYAAWALYDANIKYPNKKAQFEAYKKTQVENPSDWQEVWAKQAKDNGWPDQPDELTSGDITTQWVLFGVTFPIGAYCLVSLLLWSRRYLGADNDKLYTHGGVEVPWDAITAIDANRWASKGIARVQYDLGSGDKALVIDDWKYQREPTVAVFNRMQEHVDPEKFEGLEEDKGADIDGVTDDAVSAESQADESVTTQAK